MSATLLPASRGFKKKFDVYEPSGKTRYALPIHNLSIHKRSAIEELVIAARLLFYNVFKKKYRLHPSPTFTRCSGKPILMCESVARLFDTSRKN